MKHGLYLLLCLGFGVLPMAARASDHPTRVALMTFTVGDNSYRSALAAVDLATTLQAELSAATQFEWVERNELKAAEREFELSELGFADSASALRRGRFVAADWIVTGNFSIATNGQWNLGLKVVDVRRADVLASRTASISREAHPTLKSALPQFGAVAGEVRSALQTAVQRWNEVRDRRTLALLMLLDAEEAESGVARVLENPVAGQKPWRVIRIGAVSDSSAENELSLLGLAQQDPDAWENIADAYAWGSLTGRPTRVPHAPPTGDAILEVNVWTGSTQPQVVSVQWDVTDSAEAAVGQLPALGERLAKKISASIATNAATNAVANLRQQVAGSLYSWAATRELGRYRPSTNADEQYRKVRLQRVRLLEAACFFDPQNQPAHELLLRLRITPSMKLHGNRFPMLLRNTQAWQQYLDRFGLVQSTALPPSSYDVDTRPVAEIYLMDPYWLIDSAQSSLKEEEGFPRDMSGYVAQRWLAGFVRELVQRGVKYPGEAATLGRAHEILAFGFARPSRPMLTVEPKLRRQCIEALWPTFVARLPIGSSQGDYREICDGVRATYAELKMAGQEKELLAKLDKPKPMATNGVVRLPRASQP